MYRNSDPIPTFVLTANERAKLSFETDSFSLVLVVVTDSRFRKTRLSHTLHISV